MAGLGEFDCLAFFKEEIKNDSATIKLSAVGRLELIASALGPSRTVEDLLPYLCQVVREEPWCNDEEFLLTLAAQCAPLVPHCDGQEVLLVPLLEHLAAQEETVIRDQAVASLCFIAERKPSLAPDHVVPVLHRLATTSDFFTARVSACALLPTAYRFAREDQKAGLRKAYTSLCADDTPMVRRAAAHKMKDLMRWCETSDIIADLMAVYMQLSQEATQDTIRVAIVHTTLVLARMFTPEENKQYTLGVVRDACRDRSWRVRLTVAKVFDQLCAAFGPQFVASPFLEHLVEIMKDPEQEVRKEAVRVIEPCLHLSTPLNAEQMQTYILPSLQTLGSDSAQPVRAALAHVLGPVARVLGRDATQQQLLGLFSDLMKDEFHDVRLAMVSNAGLICDVLSIDGFVPALLPIVQNLGKDNHWRIRQSVVEQVPRLARLFGVDMFQSRLEPLVLSSLKDSVHAVRFSATQQLKEIADTFGSQWTAEHLLPRVIEQYSQSAGYVNRMTTLHTLPVVAGVMTADQIDRLFVPLLVEATKDPVPNVKICACRTIMWMLENQKFGRESINTAKPTLKELEHDSDVDVQHYALRALAACNA